MKKIFIAGAVVLFGAVNAQSFGVKAGLNITNITNLEADAKVGFHAGAFMNMPLASSFSIQPEVLYNGKGAKDGDATVNLDYISVPVMFQYNAMPNLYLEAGPEFSFLVSAKAKANSVSLDIDDAVKSFDFGVGIGAGYYFTPNIGVNLRYVAGFTDAWEDNFTDDSYLNGAFQAGLSYKF